MRAKHTVPIVAVFEQKFEENFRGRTSEL